MEKGHGKGRSVKGLGGWLEGTEAELECGMVCRWRRAGKVGWEDETRMLGVSSVMSWD